MKILNWVQWLYLKEFYLNVRFTFIYTTVINFIWTCLSPLWYLVKLFRYLDNFLVSRPYNKIVQDWSFLIVRECHFLDSGRNPFVNGDLWCASGGDAIILIIIVIIMKTPDAEGQLDMSFSLNKTYPIKNGYCFDSHHPLYDYP